MASLSELARDRTGLEPHEITHLQRLARVWGLLADLSAADLLLFAPTRTAGQYVVLAHVRPVTATTTYPTDPIGRTYDRSQRNLVAAAFDHGELVEGELELPITGERPAVVVSVPVRCRGKVVAVMSRESQPTYGRPLSDLERAYRRLFDRFVHMVTEGAYPFPRDEDDQYKAPRVGDGLLLLDADLRISYASPNAVSAIHRLGIHRPLVRRQLSDLGLEDGPLHAAVQGREPVTIEVERGADTTVVMRCLPLLEDDQVTGVMVGLRDISELRRRDRLLLSKDATIREIHHRVKNNLQTVSSLLRLQRRRLESEEARAALAESERRIASIALVHEILSEDPGDDADGDEVSFLDVVRPLVRLVEDGLSSPERPMNFAVVGDLGVVPAEVAMPLAVTLTELLQNAVLHGYGPSLSDHGNITITLAMEPGHVRMRVVDDGVGVPASFRLEDEHGLGLEIVRTFVVSDLGGQIDIRRGDGPDGAAGTVVTVDVPLASE